MSSKSEEGNNSVEVLFNEQLYDLRRRLEIIASEINHFISSVMYLCSNFVHPSLDSSHNDLFERLISAGITLEAEVVQDRKEWENFKNWWEDKEKTNNKRKYCYYFSIIWQAKMLNKSSLFAERLGELQNRLDSLLQRINSDFPRISVRRRKEQGQMDKYLFVNTQKIYDDLTDLLKEKGKNVDGSANVFAFCRYDNSSSQHSFIGEKLYREPKYTYKKKESEETNYFEPAPIVNIAFSYWLAERLVLQPVIAHEVGHQIIKEIYGRGTPFTKLSVANDELY